MEQNESQTIHFQVISSDDKLILESIEAYNETYHTDFKVEKFIYDEVIFAIISVSSFEIADIFHLGYQFGGYAEFKRQKGEIDW